MPETNRLRSGVRGSIPAVTHEDQRERIMKAAMATIAERGMAGLRMADVSERAGMSPGHILYYYRSKQRLLMETLRWSDDRLAEQRARELPRLATGEQRLRRFIEIYLPIGTLHPEWLLWLQAWALSAEVEEVSELTATLNARWAADLIAIVVFGIGRGEFGTVDPAVFSAEFLAILDGLSLHVLRDTPTLDAGRALTVAVGIAAGRLGFDPGPRPADG